MRAQQIQVDEISNNLANVNTAGYKNEKTEFKTLLYQTLQTETTTANGNPKPIPAQVGLGTRVASTTTNFTQGPMLDTESYSAAAIEGDGFFSVRGMNGDIYYTRNGNFVWSLGQNGLTLCTSEGYQVLDSEGNEITIPDGIQAERVYFFDDGSLAYLDEADNYVDMNQRFGIYQFNNPAGLNKITGTYFVESPASGAALNEATAAGVTQSKINQSYLEGSNVQVADEMVNMIIAQRAYELNSKAITTSDTMMEQANNLKR